jgi:hypothetical protein
VLELGAPQLQYRLEHCAAAAQLALQNTYTICDRLQVSDWMGG